MKIKKTILTAAILMAAVSLPAQNKSAGINISIWKDICTKPHDSTQTVSYTHLDVYKRQVFGSHHPCNAGTNQKERGICRSGRFRDSALRHHSSVGQHTENRSLRTGIDDDAGNTVRLPLVCRIYLHAGHHNDSRSGGSGRSYHCLLYTSRCV